VTSVAVSICGIAAAAIDLRTRRVPNALTGACAIAGVIVAGIGAGRVGLAASIVGGLIGLVLMLPGYLFGGTGGGDVKLLAAIGTFLGPRATLNAFIAAAIAGGLIALGLAIHRGRLQATLGRMMRIVRLSGNAAGNDPGHDADSVDAPLADHTFAYAPAIAIGAVLTVLR
jgi:prepilin peptidase CpaA